MDTVFIRGLEIDTIIGCYEHEKINKQRIVLDLEMAWDIRTAASTDDLSLTLDYNAVRLEIERLCEEKQFELVESLVECVATMIMKQFKVEGLRIRLAKPEAIENTRDVGVMIARGIAF